MAVALVVVVLSGDPEDGPATGSDLIAVGMAVVEGVAEAEAVIGAAGAAASFLEPLAMLLPPISSNILDVASAMMSFFFWCATAAAAAAA
jgi:hypothetical protein